MIFSIVRASRSLTVTLRKEGQVDLQGETPKQLDAARYCETCRNAVNTILFAGKTLFLLSTRQRQHDLRDQIHREFVYRPLQFHERRQFFIGAHDVSLAVAAMRISNPDCSFVLIHG